MMNDNFYRSSGAAIAIKRIAAGLKGVEVCAASCTNEGREEDVSWVPDGRFERFDLKSSNPIRLVRELFRLRSWLTAQRCDLVHCHHRRVAVLLRLAQIPVLYTGHLSFEYAAWFRWLHPLRMTAVSKSVAANILETTGRRVLGCIDNPTEFPVQPPLIDVDRVGGRAICIARLDPIKGHTHLLDAWKLLCDRGYGYELDLVGEGPLRASLEAQVERDELQTVVHFCGFTADVPGVIANSLFAVLVSEVEGKPLVAIEAAAMGRATLVTAVPGSMDVLPPDRRLSNGVGYGDAEALADALEEWFGSPEEVAKEGTRFFNFLRDASDPVRIASQYGAMYERVVAEYANERGSKILKWGNAT
jgi:glycosyltransferase involved in cell wall biosynthesis